MPRHVPFAEPVNNCGKCRYWRQGFAKGPLGDEGICDRTKVELEAQEHPLPRAIQWYKHTTARTLVVRDHRSDRGVSFLITKLRHSCSMWRARRGFRKQKEREPTVERGPSLWKRLMGDDF